jgi:membrane protein
MRQLISLPPRLDPLVAALKRIMAADPFLMAAAIAYNSIFALVPLSFAVVGGLSMVGSGADGLDKIEQTVTSEFPQQVADFILPILQEASSAIGGMGPVVLVVSLLVALWSGSRAIYAVQKSLRLIETTAESRSYFVTRGLGILFTFGAGVALLASYVAVIFGDWVTDTLDRFGITVGSMGWITVGVFVGWVVIVLAAIYRWGTPTPLRMSFTSAVVAALTLSLTTWLAIILVPTFGGSTLDSLGTIGVVLVWSYAIGLIIISVPARVPSIVDVVRGTDS